MRPYPRVPLKFFEQRQSVDGGNVAHRLASWKIVGTSSLCLLYGWGHSIRYAPLASGGIRVVRGSGSARTYSQGDFLQQWGQHGKRQRLIAQYSSSHPSIKCTACSTILQSDNHTLNIPDSIVLLNSQGRRVPPMSAQKQTPQIRHLGADEHGQFRVRAGLGKKGYSAPKAQPFPPVRKRPGSATV